MATFESFSEKMRQMISQSPEFHERMKQKPVNQSDSLKMTFLSRGDAMNLKLYQVADSFIAIANKLEESNAPTRCHSRHAEGRPMPVEKKRQRQ